jgi:hypothetical protein
MCGAGSTHLRNEKYLENLKEREHFKYLDIDGRIILKWISENRA